MHDWNQPQSTGSRSLPSVLRVVDETLRDGLQSPSVKDPPIERKIELLHAMAAIGVDVVSLGFPMSGARAASDAVALAREIATARLGLEPTAAARTTAPDVEAVARVSARAGVAITVYALVGSSPVRHYVEGWSVDFLLRGIGVAGQTARKAELPFCLVTEDTTRTPPDVLATLFSAAVDAGATRLCLCDTVGHATPHGAAALVTFARTTLAKRGAEHVTLDWHGHDDRGLALTNALAAARAGVDGVHATALGIGERAGNTRMRDLLASLPTPPRRDAVDRYDALAARALGVLSGP